MATNSCVFASRRNSINREIVTQPSRRVSTGVEEQRSDHTQLATETQQSLDNVLCIKEYSNLCRLIKVLAYVLRAIKLFNYARLQLRNKSLTLIPAELASAEKLLITHIQNTLVIDRNFPSLKKQLDLFVDDHGLWRCGGRLTNTDIPYSTKHPVLLPRDHHFTVLIVRDAHERELPMTESERHSPKSDKISGSSRVEV